MTAFTESTVEEADLGWLEAGGRQMAHGPDIARTWPVWSERNTARSSSPSACWMPSTPQPGTAHRAAAAAVRKLTRPVGADLIQRNRALHWLLLVGVTVEYRDPEGALRA